MNAETAKLLEKVDPGKGRFWSVTLIKNADKNPIRVTLHEEVVEGRRALSTAIGFARCIAAPQAVADAADLVLAQVGDYERVIGEYPLEPVSEA